MVSVRCRFTRRFSIKRVASGAKENPQALLVTSSHGHRRKSSSFAWHQLRCTLVVSHRAALVTALIKAVSKKKSFGEVAPDNLSLLITLIACLWGHGSLGPVSAATMIGFE